LGECQATIAGTFRLSQASLNRNLVVATVHLLSPIVNFAFGGFMKTRPMLARASLSIFLAAGILARRKFR